MLPFIPPIEKTACVCINVTIYRWLSILVISSVSCYPTWKIELQLVVLTGRRGVCLWVMSSCLVSVSTAVWKANWADLLICLEQCQKKCCCCDIEHIHKVKCHQPHVWKELANGLQYPCSQILWHLNNTDIVLLRRLATHIDIRENSFCISVNLPLSFEVCFVLKW